MIPKPTSDYSPILTLHSPSNPQNNNQKPGISAAFDAPTSGALFAVEFVLKSSRLGLDRLSTSTVFASTSVAAGVVGFLRSEGRALGIAGASQHLVGRIPYFSIQPNLLIDVLQVSKSAGRTRFGRAFAGGGLS